MTLTAEGRVDDADLAWARLTSDWVDRAWERHLQFVADDLACEDLAAAFTACAAELTDDAHDPAADGFWAVPGVTGLRRAAPESVPPSPQVQALQAAVAALAAVDPSRLPQAQALADADALLAVEQQLRVLDLARIADVQGRALHELSGDRSTSAWVRRHRPDGDSGDAPLAAQLRHLPVLHEAVRTGSTSLAAARKTSAALRTCLPHLDRADGLIDGQPGTEVLDAIVGNTAALVLRGLHGLSDDDPRLTGILERAQQLLSADAQAQTQAQRLETAFTWLASELSPRLLTAALDELVLAVLPSELEDRDDRGRSRRRLDLTPLSDGTGWHLCADLDLETGERLWTALRAAAQRDPENPTDTAAWEAARSAAEQHGAGTFDAVDLLAGAGPAFGPLPRERRTRLHDAFSWLLQRYLDAGLGGLTGKAPVQVHVTIPEAALTNRPGAPPPRGDSGQRIPRHLVRRWWCDSSVTAFALSLGGKALRVVHAQRTITADERRALQVESGGTCVGDGCCPTGPDLLVALVPHHVLGYAEHQVTALDETVLVCPTLHQDLHHGKTVRLRDGRYLSERGFGDGPATDEAAPF